jgi:hypothetical protein
MSMLSFVMLFYELHDASSQSKMYMFGRFTPLLGIAKSRLFASDFGVHRENPTGGRTPVAFGRSQTVPCSYA